MLHFNFFPKTKTPKILCLGAHPDDIEIGCGGTILKIAEQVPNAQFYWVVFSGNVKRQKEANESVKVFSEYAKIGKLVQKNFRDSYFPFCGAEIKDFFVELQNSLVPDLIFTHYAKDAHQDHRLISDLTWNSFRDNLILEYEIPKYDGDLRTPNLYVSLSESQAKNKIKNIFKAFSSQKEKFWFDEAIFLSILRIRGIEVNAEEKFAEGFYCRKILF